MYRWVHHGHSQSSIGGDPLVTLPRVDVASTLGAVQIDMIEFESMGFRMNTRVLTAHVPLPLADKVDQLAARLERSRGWIVKQALAAWVDQEEERGRLTLEALADVDAHQVIAHQAVQAWAASLGTDSTLPLPIVD